MLPVPAATVLTLRLLSACCTAPVHVDEELVAVAGRVRDERVPAGVGPHLDHAVLHLEVELRRLQRQSHHSLESISMHICAHVIGAILQVQCIGMESTAACSPEVLQTA